MTADRLLPLEGGEVFSRPVPGKRQPRPSDPSSDPSTHPGQKPVDLFTYRAPEPKTCLTPVEAPLFIVPGRQFSDRDCTDGWLYLLAEPTAAAFFLDGGLPLNNKAPVILMERPALHGCFMQIEEDAGQACLLLRTRKTLLAPWLEPDPDHTARFGASCYLLVEKPQG